VIQVEALFSSRSGLKDFEPRMVDKAAVSSLGEAMIVTLHQQSANVSSQVVAKKDIISQPHRTQGSRLTTQGLKSGTIKVNPMGKITPS